MEFAGNIREAISLLLIAAVGSCGPAGVRERLEVRPGYTADHVVAAFERRYDSAREGLPEGTATIEGLPGTFPLISHAIAQAPRGGIVKLSPGIFRESVVLAGKDLSILGAGADKTFIVSSETGLFAKRSSIVLSNLSLISLSMGPDVAVVALSESSAEISDCKIMGGTGPGLLVAGKTCNVSLIGNVITGNMGGGMRVQGGNVRLVRNSILRNALSGIVLSPTSPDSISSFSSWHDTILDNWAGQQCVSFSRLGVVPISSPDVFSFEGSILNVGGIEETFSPVFLRTVKERGRNFLSVSALPAEDFFVDASLGDLSPRAPLVKDDLGFELGAFPSTQGRADLSARLSNALLSEKLHIAWLISLFLSPSERCRTAEQVRGTVHRWTEEFLRCGKLGGRLLTTVALYPFAPRSWRLEVILGRFKDAFVKNHTFSLKPISFFPDNPELGASVMQHLQSQTLLFPRYIILSADSPNAFVLTGRMISPLVQTSTTRPLSVVRHLANPFHEEINATIAMLESRLKENKKKYKELKFTLENPHIQQGERYRSSLVKQLEGLEKSSARMEAQLAQARKQLENSSPEFVVKVEGVIRETEVKGEVFITVAAAPSGDIMLDETRELTYRHTSIEVAPVPEFDFPGLTISGEFARPEDQASREIAQLILRSMIEKETSQLRHLLEQFRGRVIDASGEDRLTELLLLNSRLFSRALGAKSEYHSLRSAARKPKAEVEVTVSYDPTKGSGKQGVRIKVASNDQAAIASRVADMEAIYKPYWELEDLVSYFLSARYDLGLRQLFKAALILEQLPSL